MVQKKLEKSIDLGILKTLKGGGNKKVSKGAGNKESRILGGRKLWKN